MQLTKLLTSLSAFTLLATAASAQSIIYEPFDYTTGDLAGNSGATGLDGSWANGDLEYGVDASGLSFTNLTGVGGHAVRQTRSGDSTASIGITAGAQTSLTAGNSSIYFSLLVNANGSYTRYANAAMVFATDPLDNGGAGPVGIAASGEGFGFTLDGEDGVSGTTEIYLHGVSYDGGSGTQSGTFVTTDQSTTHMIVGKIDWVPNGSLDTLTLWDVADPNAGLGSSFATMTADIDNSLIDTITMGDQQLGQVDEIRFDTSLEGVGVVPEPSSFALISGLLGLTWVMLRRR